MVKAAYELVIGLNKGKKVVKNERKPKPAASKGVSDETATHVARSRRKHGLTPVLTLFSNHHRFPFTPAPPS